MTAAPGEIARPPRQSLGRALVAPRSLALLALALLLSTTAALLAHWQVSRAIEQGTVQDRPTETVLALTRVATPGQQQTEASVGQLVTTNGRLVPEDVVVVADRLNAGTRGWWVVGHAVVDDPAGADLAVGLGWAPTEQAARAAADRIREGGAEDRVLTGRYVDSDPAEPSTSGSPTALTAVSTARLVNLWSAVDGPIYEGVLVLRDAPSGLTAISAPRPRQTVELNLLNVLYAVEWVFFAGAFLYVWYRLVRDRWEQEAAAGREGVPA